jgi:hypothetical protein
MGVEGKPPRQARAQEEATVRLRAFCIIASDAPVHVTVHCSYDAPKGMQTRMVQCGTGGPQGGLKTETIRTRIQYKCNALRLLKV